MAEKEDHKAKGIRWSIKWKLIIIMALLMGCLIALLSYTQFRTERNVLQNELNQRIALMKANLIERGKSDTVNLSRQVENQIASFNFSGAVEAINESVKNNPEIKYAILMDASGLVHLHTRKPELAQTHLFEEREQVALTQLKLRALEYNEENGSVIEIVNPIQISMTPWGILRMIYSLRTLTQEIEMSRTRFRKEMDQMVLRSVITSLIFLAVCIVIIFLLSTKISTPLVQLTDSARKLSKGDFSAASEIDIRSRDEVGLLSETFTQMSRDLEESYRKLEDYSKTLEEKVAKRTWEVQKALHDTAEARDRIDGIIKSVADGLIVTDKENRLILMNRAAEDLLRVRLSEVIDRPIDFAIEEETLREKVKETLGKKSTGYHFDFNLPGQEEKHPRIMRARTSVIHDRDGKETGIVTIMNDVTYEREVDRMKTEFLSTAAHELRTPLTSIQGFSEILLTRDDIGAKEAAKFLQYINKQSIGLTNIINDLLDISRIESGRGFALNKGFYNTSDSLLDIVPYFREQFKQHQYDVIALKKPFELYADKEKMEQVLKNLLSNASKYSPEPGLIKITETLSKNLYILTVEDQGSGMAPEQVDLMFEKFYRVDASDSGIEGTGLGMTIVKHIVEAHNGNIIVESELDKGTKVTVTVPIDGK